MTNNYFKAFHYLSVLGLSVDERALLFFFDDSNSEGTEKALRWAHECFSSIRSLTFGRRVQLSVYRELRRYPHIQRVGDVVENHGQPVK